ncbi:MAG: hypothetical protein AABY18_00930 [Candidatus Thermoplasmatota archaeon]
MGNELTGILSGTGAKMKGEVMDDHVVFRGAVKAEVPFEDIVAEARGTLLILSFGGHTVELGAGARASQLASKVRSPPSRLDRLGIEYGTSAATAGPVDAHFKSELGARAVVAPGVPKEPVDALFFAVAAAAQLAPLAKLAPLVKPGGTLWLVATRGAMPDSQVAAAAKAAGLKVGASVRFSPTQVATRLTHAA